jgi:hypothetical protein
MSPADPGLPKIMFGGDDNPEPTRPGRHGSEDSGVGPV